MQYILSLILTVIVSFTMSSAVTELVSQTPQEAVEDTMKALENQKREVFELHGENAYVNFLNNVQGDEKAAAAVCDAIFENFSYEIVKAKQKNDVAVVKIIIRTSDFSGVDAAYKKASHEYIMENLGTDKVSDRKALSAKCTELYVAEIEKAVQSGAVIEETEFVPMIDNGYHGWNVIITDDMMKAVFGNLQLPVSQQNAAK